MVQFKFKWVKNPGTVGEGGYKDERTQKAGTH